MGKCQVLLVHSPNMPFSPVQKLLEDRDFAILLSRNWEEAERARALVPADQLKYIFLDATLCTGAGWEQFLYRLQQATADVVCVSFHPRFPHTLAQLLAHLPDGTTAEPLHAPAQAPVVVGESASFRAVLKLAQRYAHYDITVLVTGETGAGKEVMARYIHAHSSRHDKPLVACNLTAIPDTLVESELFGYVKGAFTGADKHKKGLIEAAEGGTLFLDEIGDLQPATQLKLLRFLESREFYKVGDSTAKTADVRIIAATNKDLERAMVEKGFREDLYYRLNSARLIVPPLRERVEDLLVLATTFVEQVCQQTQRPLMKVSSSVQSLLATYPWPGNIREFKNAIESAVMVADGEYVTLSDLPMHLQRYATSHHEEIGVRTIHRIDEAERDVIEEALQKTNWDKARAAALLGISLRTLYRKLEKFLPSEEKT